MLLMCRCLFRRRRASVNSTLAAVIADMVHSGFVDYGLVVNIVNVRDVHIIHRTVVVEGSVVPISTSIADATIAKPVVDAAVEADMRTPVAFIPGIGVAPPTPIARCPEEARLRSHHPSPRHPEVAFIAICPVARRPQITGGGAHGLRVNGERGRSDHDRHAELRQRDGRYSQYQKSEQ